MKELKLPKTIRKILEDEKAQVGACLASSPVDMNGEAEFQDGYVVLTEQMLYRFLSTKSRDTVHYFKGYGSKVEMYQSEDDQEWAIRRFAIEEMEGLWMESQVACNLLVLKTAEMDYHLAACSNFYKHKVQHLIRMYEQLKKPEAERDMDIELEEEAYCPHCGRMYPDQESKKCPKCINRRSVFFRAMGYLKPYVFELSMMLLCVLISTGLNLIWPYLNGTILYDKVLAKNEAFLVQLGIEDGAFVTALLMVVLTMLATKVVLLILQICQGIFTARVVSFVVRDMKKDIFRVMGKLSISFYRSKQTGSLMTRVMSDAERITNFYFDGLPYIFIYGLVIISTLVVMWSINWKMTIVSVLMMPVLFVFNWYLRPRIWNLFGKRHRAERTVNSAINDNLTGARVVKSFGQEQREQKRFRQPNKRLYDAEMAISYQQNFFRIIYGGAMELASLAVWGLGVYFVIGQQNMNLGTLLTFVGYVGQLNHPMEFLSRVYHWWADSMNSAQRMFEIIDAISEVQESEHPIPLKEPKGGITLNHVTFGYEENRPVLKDINLDIPAGSMLGIVGRSGAGKTTIVNLISRMYDPQEGSIAIDGINVKDLSFKDLRSNVAMVSQETYIFMGTVAENIAYAKQDAKPEEILRAAKLAGAHDFIMRMPDGYDTKIGSSGRELSGGERQRISIARAILADPKILILDEATASVDTETERVIQASINHLVKGRTTISIAHRLSTLRDANYLVVIDDGKITERGTHKELEALRGTYFKLMELQTKALALKEEM